MKIQIDYLANGDRFLIRNGGIKATKRRAAHDNRVGELPTMERSEIILDLGFFGRWLFAARGIFGGVRDGAPFENDLRRGAGGTSHA